METPSSTRRVTRSQTMASANKNNNNIPISKKFEESEMGVTKSMKRNGKQQLDRSALIDITNDSPIVGLAMESLDTPSSAMSKNRVNGKVKYCTPGSGEALLRGQVKTLLQKVEEEAVFSKLSLEKKPFLYVPGVVNSPLMGLLAPTPANTPQVVNFSANGSSQINDLACVTASPVEDKLFISQLVAEKGVESEKDCVTRSLLLDFSEKIGEESEDSSKEKIPSSTDDDDSSVWSIQVNVSSTRDDEEEGLEEVEEECDCEEEYDEEGGDDDEEGLVDELCEGIRKMTMAKFAGKHTRFVYNSDGELEGEEECCDVESTPMGKQLCFHEESEEE